MEVLVYLADLEGQVATLESIHDDLWAGKVVSSGTIYNCIAELRQAFSKSGEKINYIETLPKKGYRLAPPIVAMPTSPGNHRTDNSIAIMPLVNRSGDADIETLYVAELGDGQLPQTRVILFIETETKLFMSQYKSTFTR